MSHSTRLIVAGVLAPLLALASAPATPPVPRTLSLSGQIEITVDTYPAEGRFLLLWIAPGFGFRPAHPQTAARLAAAGLEVWLADVAEALFLPRGSRSMRELDGTYVADLIERAHSATGKAVVLVGGSYGAIPALRGARAWQARAPARPYLTGAVLFSPNAYARVPPLGADPQYLPIVRTTRLPIAILQGERNANRWQLPRLREALESGGSPVHVTLLPEVTGLFFQEPDEPWPAAAQREIDALPGRLARLLPLLERT
nr:TlpA family protein disulfide reductase [Gammaproteobacteria bacterium]